MIKLLQKIFKIKQKSQVIHSVSDSICFDDLSGQNFIIRAKTNNNEKILSIVNVKNNNEIYLDSEQCLLLAAIFSEFANNKKIDTMINIISEE